MWGNLKYLCRPIFRSSVDFINGFLWPFYNEPNDVVLTLVLVLTVENKRFSFHVSIPSLQSSVFKATSTTLINPEPDGHFICKVLFEVLDLDLPNVHVTSKIARLVLQHYRFQENVDISKLEVETLLELYNFVHTCGLLDLEHHIVKHLKILQNANFPDNESLVVYLIVEKVQFPCHKRILAAKSKYFRCLFYGSVSDPSRNVFDLKEEFLNPQNFRRFLEHIYKLQIDFQDLEFDELLDLCKIAHCYWLTEFENCILEQLRTKFVPDRIWENYFKLKTFPETSLLEFCYTFIDKDGTKFLESDEFLSLSKIDLMSMLYPDYFYAAEVDIFLAIRRWIEANACREKPEKDVEELYSLVRFPNMEDNELLYVVGPTGVISEDQNFEIFRTVMNTKNYNLKHRGYLNPGENVAKRRFGSNVILGRKKKRKIKNRRFSNPTKYISQLLHERIIIKLGKACFINTISMILYNKNEREYRYKYFIEISVDYNQWLRVINRTSEWCESKQELKFPTRVVRYIAIVGTDFSTKSCYSAAHLRVARFKCSYEYVDDGNNI